jgi:hypothetical protein
MSKNSLHCSGSKGLLSSNQSGKLSSPRKKVEFGVSKNNKIIMKQENKSKKLCSTGSTTTPTPGKRLVAKGKTKEP